MTAMTAMRNRASAEHPPMSQPLRGQFFQQPCRAAALAAATGALICFGASHASETERVGGTGGQRTWRLECEQADGLLTGMYALGGPRTPLDMSLVRQVGFVCRGFGAGAYERWTQVVPPVGGFEVINETFNEVHCPPGEALYAIDVRAGLYVDSIRAVRCRNRAGRASSPIQVNVGGSGGQDWSLQCPAGEALYRVDAKAGTAIDSLKGYCRRFPPPQVDPNAPVFDGAPAQGAVVTLYGMYGGEIPVRAHGATGPVTLSLQVLSPYASRFELVQPPMVTRVPGAQLAAAAPATSISRTLRVKGPIPVGTLGPTLVPITLTLRDGAGRTAVRRFQVRLR